MKIAYFSGSTIPSLTANSIQVMKMCQAMVQNGHEPTLYAIHGDDNSVVGPNGDIWRHYGIRDHFDIHRFKNISRLRGYNVAFASVLHASRMHVDLIFARNTIAAAIASVLGYPTIYELHQMPSGRIGPLWLRLILSGKRFLRLITITEALRKAMLVKYPGWLKGKEIIVAHDAVDLDQFTDLPSPVEARNRLNLPQKFTAGYAGSLYHGRGVELIQELAILMPDVQFFVMGGNTIDVESRKKKAFEKKINNINFFGFVPNADLPLCLAACEVLLMPYQERVAVSSGGDTSKVFSPIKLFEYMAMKRLIISSNLSVLREILNEKNSILCAPDSIDEWHAAIRQGMKNEDLYFTLTNQARTEVENYTWRKRMIRCFTNHGIDYGIIG